MKRVLVTGGFGFIGGHLVARLLQEDALVHVVDDLSSNPIPHERLLEELGNPANLSYSIMRVDEFVTPPPEPLSPLPKSREPLVRPINGEGLARELRTARMPSLPALDWQFDEIYHLASPVGPAGVLQHAGEMVRQIVHDTYALMDLARRCGAKLVDVSTSEVYGGGQDGYCREDLDKIIPAETTVRLEYAVAKLAAETAIINTAKVSDLKAAIVRPFNVAGPRQSGVGGFVLPRFIQQAMDGKPLTVFGNGTQMRAFTHVEDIADGIIRVMAQGKNGEAYNLGNPGNKTTILALAQTVNRVLENQAGVTFVDPRDIWGPLYAEAADKFPDASKAMDELDWAPMKDIGATIADAYGYVRESEGVRVGDD